MDIHPVIEENARSIGGSIYPKAIASDEWPMWAKALKLLSKPEDKGIGDVIARVIGNENSKAFEAWHVKTFGRPCNCKGRQMRWNSLYPLSLK